MADFGTPVTGLTAIRYLVSATVREAVRAKLLYVAIFFSVMILASGSLFGSVSIGDHVQIVKDFGLFSVSIVSVLFTILSGSSLLNKELSQKTIYNIMSKPICRWHFIVAKFIALALIGSGLVLSMGGLLSLYVSALQSSFDISLLVAYVFMMLEIILIAAVIMFFSSIVVTPLLNGLFTIGIFMVGRCSVYLKGVPGVESNSFQKSFYYVVPHFDSLWVADGVVFKVFPDITYFCYSLAYVILYSTMLIITACIVFHYKEFN
jgi:ABC-type transport system involved in multi-copper enzyme maturation permease subunit